MINETFNLKTLKLLVTPETEAQRSFAQAALSYKTERACTAYAELLWAS